MELSTGKIPFKINFSNGTTDYIYINPYDKGLQRRISVFEKNLSEKIDQIDIEKHRGAFETINKEIIQKIDFDDLDSLFAMSKEELEEMQKLVDIDNEIEKEVNDAVKSELNEVFDSDISSVVFRYCEPFDIVNYTADDGTQMCEMYILQFMKWLAIEIKKHFNECKNVYDKYTAKYVKK